MDTLLKTHNKLQFLHPVHGFADKVSAFSSLKPQNLEPKFHSKKSHTKLSKGFCVKASSSALLELVPETKKENLEFELPMYDPSKGLVVDLAVVGGGPAGLAVAQQVSEAGLSVCSIDPSPKLIWPNNYGVWVDTAERAGKVEVSAKQVWNWFQNRRYALRARAAKTPVPGEVNVSPMPRDDQATVRNVPQAPQPQPAPSMKSVPQVPHPLPAPSAQSAGRNASDSSQMEFEAKSARDGAWYDVTSFLSHRSLETGDPEALVRFAGFGPEEDEWVNIRRHVRQRSLPCESSECVAVLPGDLILCFQEGKEQALYFDAHVLDAQRRRHDVRGCRCRFLVRYDHDQSEEIVPLRKICRRPETDYRLQQLHAGSTNVNPQKTGVDPQAGNTVKFNVTGETTQKQPKPEEQVDYGAITAFTPANVPIAGESKLPPSKINAEMLLKS